MARYTLTNMVTSSSVRRFESTWYARLISSNGSFVSSPRKYGSSSFRMLCPSNRQEEYALGSSVSFVNNRKYFIGFWVYSTSSSFGTAFFSPWNTANSFTFERRLSGANQWHFVSDIRTAPSDAGYQNIRVDNDTPGSYITYDGITILDLTATFGAGKEPSLAQMNSIMASAGGFIDGSTSVDITTNGTKVRVGGAWKTGVPKVRVSGAWRGGVSKVRVNGAWKSL